MSKIKLCTRCGHSREDHKMVKTDGFIEWVRICPSALFSAEAESIVDVYKRVATARKLAGADDDEALRELTEQPQQDDH